MKFEWDPAKAKDNLRKHGVSFEEAVTIFDDSLAITYADPDHSVTERRELTIGVSERDRLLIVSQADRSGTMRIISARRATRKERKIYEEG